MDQDEFDGSHEDGGNLPQEIESLIQRNHATLKRIHTIVEQMKTQEEQQSSRRSGDSA
jgi:hypothetical protein